MHAVYIVVCKASFVFRGTFEHNTPPTPPTHHYHVVFLTRVLRYSPEYFFLSAHHMKDENLYLLSV